MTWSVQPNAAASLNAGVQPQLMAAQPAMGAAAANPLAALASVTSTLTAAFPGLLGPQAAVTGAVPFAGQQQLGVAGAPAVMPTMQDTLNFITSGPTEMTPLATASAPLVMAQGNTVANGFIPGQDSAKVAEFFADEAPGGAGDADSADADAAEGEGGGSADILKKIADLKKAEGGGDAGKSDETDEASEADGDEEKPASGSDDDAPASPKLLAALVAKIAAVEEDKDRYRGGSKIQAETVKLDKGVPDNLPSSA